MIAKVIVSFFVLVNLLHRVQSDALSISTSGMEVLVSKETFLLDNLELYLGALKKKVEIIQSNLDRMRAENDKALLNPEVYVMNPLQSFPLLRRLHSDWVNWELFMEKSIGEEYIDIIKKERPNLPTEEETQEATDAIFRLQDTYKLNPLEMSTGKLNGIQYDAKLSAIDCFSIGLHLHEKKKYEEAALWFQSAINMFEDTDSINEVLGFDKKKVYHAFVQTYAKQGLFDRAILLIDELLVIDPQDTSALQLKQELQKKAKEKRPVPKPKEVSLKTQKYERACQGRYPARVSNLYCFYNTTTDPFLKLAPFKMELISLDPYIVVFHDVISDNEIENLKNLAKPKLIRSRVYSESQKKGVPVPTRTSKVAWFPDDFNAQIKTFNKRIEDMTGFSLSASEQLQVMNYGLGGHYLTHLDYFNSSSSIVEPLGNRIATALFYLTDVEQGGATAFLNAELAVFPKKGSCLFWYNLDMKGDGIENTLHAACPVIVGSKWICNKWIRDRQQLFRRPCWR